MSTIIAPTTDLLGDSSDIYPTTKIEDCLINSIQCGDASFLLRQFPANSVDLIITSPPYYQQRNYIGAVKSVGIESSVEYYIDPSYSSQPPISAKSLPCSHSEYLFRKYRDFTEKFW